MVKLAKYSNVYRAIRRCVRLATLTVTIGLCAPSARATIYSWTGSSSGLWTVATNYIPSTGTPVAADTVNFNAPGTNTASELIYLNGNQAATSLIFNNTGTTGLLGGTSTTAAANSLALTAGITVNAGAGAVTIGDAASATDAVNLTFTTFLTLTNNSTSALTFGNSVTMNNTSTTATLTLGGTGNFVFDGSLNQSAHTLSLVASGTGTTTLAGANNYSGTTTITNGTLNLDYSTNASSHLSTTAALILNSATVNLVGGTGFIQVVGSSTLSGVNTLGRPSGSSILQLGAIGRTGGGTLNLVTGGIATTSTVFTNGILPYVTVGATTGVADWGSTTDTGTNKSINAYSAYTAYDGTASDATANYLLAGGATDSGSINANSLKINSSASGSQVLDLGGGTLNLTSGGLMYVGASAYSITDGTLLSSASPVDLIVQQWGAGSLTIATPITTGAGANLTKVGTGNLILSGDNTYAGTNYVNQGKLTAGIAGDAFGNSAAVQLASGTTLDLSGAGFNETIGTLASSTGATSGSILLGANTLTIAGSSGTATFVGVISGTGGLTKNSGNTEVLTGTSTYSGVTMLTGGVVNTAFLANVNQPSPIGMGSVAGSAADLVLDNGGELQYSGATATNTNRLFTLGAYGTLDSSSAATNATMNFTSAGAIAFTGFQGSILTLQGSNAGTTDVNNAGAVTVPNQFAPLLADASVANGLLTSVVKSGASTWNLSNGGNTYSGGTQINLGRLISSATGSFGSGLVNVISGGQAVLAGGGTYTNPFSLAGVGVNLAVSGGVHAVAGALVVTNASTEAGTITLLANSRISATPVNSGFTATGTITGQITGGYNLSFDSGGTSAGGTAGGTITLMNTANNWTGDTTINTTATSGGSTMIVALGVSEVIPNGAGAGNLYVSQGGSSGGATLNLGAFTETVNGLYTGTFTYSDKETVTGTAGSSFRIGDNNANGAWYSQITGAVAVTKIGTGTQIFGSGPSINTTTIGGAAVHYQVGDTYSGGTTVSGGNLQLTNTNSTGATTFGITSATGTGIVNLSGGTTTTISGIGSSAGMLTVTNGSRIAPGVNTSGANTNFGVAGTLTLGNGVGPQGAATATSGITLTAANLDFDLSSTASSGNDLIATKGVLTLGSLAFTFNELSTGSLDTANAYTLISGATSTVGSLAGVTGTVIQGGYVPMFALSGNNLVVTFSAAPVPEPGAGMIALIGSIVAGAITLRRTRRTNRGLLA